MNQFFEIEKSGEKILPVLWYYKYLVEWRNKYFNDIVTMSDIDKEEIAIGDKDYKQFFYIAKINFKSYLIPSEIVENKEVPIMITQTTKIAYRNKAYHKVLAYKTVKIRPERFMSYRELIDNMCPFKHQKNELLTLWKIIVETAFASRINIRVITYPGWMKDSITTSLNILTQKLPVVNKPSIGKIKRILYDDTEVLGLNEVQKLSEDETRSLASFYEDVGDLKPEWINPKRSVKGSKDVYDISNLSTVTFYNFPDSKKYDNTEKLEQLFEYIFEPKIRSRVMPLLFKGGDDDTPACLEKFDKSVPEVTESNKVIMMKWVKTLYHYKEQGEQYIKKSRLKQRKFLKNNRWNKSFTTIMDRIKLYAQNEDEYRMYENMLYESITDYIEYVKKLYKENVDNETVQVKLNDVDMINITEENVEDQESDTKQQIVEFVTMKKKARVEEIVEHIKKDDTEKMVEQMCKEGTLFNNNGYIEIL